MSLTPTEYFQRNFWVGASFLRPSESAAALRGRRRPHHVGRRLPALAKAATRTRPRRCAPRSPTCRRPRRSMMLETNAADVYGFDLDALRKIGDRDRPDGRPRCTCRSTRPTIPPTPRATRSTPSKSSRPGDTTKGAPHDRSATARERPSSSATARSRRRPAKIWSTAVTVVWETDPDVIKAVLPPPLEPSRAAGPHPLRDRRHGHRHPGVRRGLVRRARPARQQSRASTRCSCR